MKVFALIYTIGISSGSETLIGLFSTEEKAEEKMEEHMRKTCNSIRHYEIEEIEVDKEVNITIAEW